MDVYTIWILLTACVGISSAQRRNGNIMNQRTMVGSSDPYLFDARLLAIRNPRGKTSQYIILTRTNTAVNNRNPLNTKTSRRRNYLRSRPIRRRLTHRSKLPLGKNTNNKINSLLRNRIYHHTQHRGTTDWQRLRQTHLNEHTLMNNKRPFGQHGAAQEKRLRKPTNFTPGSNIFKQNNKHILISGRKGTRRARARRNRIEPSSVSNISPVQLKSSRDITTGPEKGQVRSFIDNMRSNMNRKSRQSSHSLSNKITAARAKQTRSGQSGKTLKRSRETIREVQYKHNKISLPNKHRDMNAKAHAQSTKKNSETNSSGGNINEAFNTSNSIRGSLKHIQKQINMLMKQLNYNRNNIVSTKQSLNYKNNKPEKLNRNTIPDIEPAPESSSEAKALPSKSKAKPEKHITQESKINDNVPNQKKTTQNNQNITLTKTVGKESKQKKIATIKTTTQDPETALEDPVTTIKPVANKMTDLIFYQPGSKPLRVSVQQGAKITHVREQNGTSKLVIESKPLIKTAATNVTTEEPPEIEAP